jgi:hypothetical protein
MARRRYGFDEDRIARFLKEGRGTGVGRDYLPWLTVSDISSRGRSHRTWCSKTDRAHHLFSDGEHYAFHLLWWDDHVVDMREQFPLLRIETLAIAAHLKIKHPADRTSGAPLVQTTDFLVTRRVGESQTLEAISVKPDDEIGRKRTLEKLEIERQYWLRRGISWQLLLHSDIKTIYARNLVWILASVECRAGRGSLTRVGHLYRPFLDHIAEMRNIPIRLACGAFDQANELATGTALGILRRLLAAKRITTDLYQRNLQDQPCSAYREVKLP